MGLQVVLDLPFNLLFNYQLKLQQRQKNDNLYKNDNL